MFAIVRIEGGVRLARRKTLLVIVILGLMALFLSPWTATPVPKPQPSSVPEQPSEPLAVTTAATEESPADLSIAAVMDEDGFEQLRRQSDDYQTRHPDVTVRWARIDPASASLAGDIQEGIETSDLMLVPNEWVRDLAVGGSLQPVDSVFVGDALSEQLEAVISQMKWNGYLWGVPRSMDPYVLLWNKNVLDSLQSGTDSVIPPLSLEQWRNLPQLLADKGLIASWLAVDGTDPFALLTWLGAVTGKRQDAMFDRTDAIWSSVSLDKALQLLDEQRAGIADIQNEAEFWPAFAAGRFAAAVARDSVAKRALAELPDSAKSAILIDRSVWQSPFVWPNGTSFVLSSRSTQGDAAKRWLTEMTGPSLQLDNYEKEGLLPVNRPLYSQLTGSEKVLASAPASEFPNQATVAEEPSLPGLTARLRTLWSNWFQGQLESREWKERWLGSLADTKSYD